MKTSKGHPTSSHSFPAESIYRYATHHLLIDRTMSTVGSDFDPECLSMQSWYNRNLAQAFEKKTYDRPSGSINWSKQTVPQIKDYLSATNDYLEGETGNMTHAHKIRERISQIERASKTALTDLDKIRGEMWEGYRFDRDTVCPPCAYAMMEIADFQCVTFVILGRRPDPTLRPDDTTLDPGAVDRSPLPETEAVSDEDEGGLVEKEEMTTDVLEDKGGLVEEEKMSTDVLGEGDWVLLDGHESKAGRTAEK